MATQHYRWDDSGAPVIEGVVGSYSSAMVQLLVGSSGIAYGSKPAAGWTLAYSATNKVALRNSLADGGTGCYLRIDDTGGSAGGAKVARVDIYESMSDIDTGTNPAAGGYVWKSSAASSGARAWTITADSRTLYGTHCVNTTSPPATTTGNGSGVYNNTCCYGCGDYLPSIPGDPGCFGAFPETENPASNSLSTLVSAGLSGLTTGLYDGFRLSRDTSLSATQVRAGMPLLGSTASGSGQGFGGTAGNTTLFASPTPGHLGNHFAPAFLMAGGTFRGRMRGLFLPMNQIVSLAGFHVGSTQVPLGDPSTTLACLIGIASIANAGAASGRVFADTTGDWG